jgi:hypothetical protein
MSNLFPLIKIVSLAIDVLLLDSICLASLSSSKKDKKRPPLGGLFYGERKAQQKFTGNY